ncbi:MAG: hypothetical protein KBF06_01515 [Bacteroidales bacterium]|nr:hypothetical protein [Bacteroidales bacterium]MDI9574681.1 hypothetical protein [Bacteroidota bacterium]OQC60828.1 MAG: hypothetical protein BWX51_00783 [Bacteroidetes bacterium ADurb.Bin012]MBP9588353.1 hypothetical protein [Bacteroidales bacterium]HNU21280.1 hypothetical protein [Bacteroidales bacterium]
MKPKIRRIRFFKIMGKVVGLAMGYPYYKQIGCNAGGCRITSNSYLSVLWGMFIGVFDCHHIAYTSEIQPSKLIS